MRHPFLRHSVYVLLILKYASFNLIVTPLPPYTHIFYIFNKKSTVKVRNTKLTPCICCNIKIKMTLAYRRRTINYISPRTMGVILLRFSLRKIMIKNTSFVVIKFYAS